MTDWDQYSVMETPEHLMIKHLSQQIRERIDKLEWMLSQTAMTNERREELETAWRNHQNAKAAPSSESDKDSSPPTT